jgi:GT2 family glycosyltransferase
MGSMTSGNGATLEGDGENLLVVVLCYRVPELTMDCLRSIAPQIRDVPRARVVVCENGTGAETVKRLREFILSNNWSDWATLQAISPNVGFTGGNNAVLRPAMKWAHPPKYFLLLNADTIVQPGALRCLYEAMERSPEIGIMGANLVGMDGRGQVCRFRDHTPLSEFLRGAGSSLVNRMVGREAFQLEPSSDAAYYEWISFAAGMIRSDVVRDVGLLDEGYFLYFDDADYCRMARKAGWRIGYCDEARIIHLEGQSNEVPTKSSFGQRRPKYYYVSRARYFAKHGGALAFWAANMAWTAGAAIAMVERIKSRRSVAICESEWKDIWTNAWAPVRKSNATLVPAESHVVL